MGLGPKDYLHYCNCGVCKSLRDDRGSSCNGCREHHSDRKNLLSLVNDSMLKDDEVISFLQEILNMCHEHPVTFELNSREIHERVTALLLKP